MKIIAINGHKNSGKVNLAEKWNKNENVSFIKPYSDNYRPLDYKVISREDLDFMVEHNVALASTIVNEHIYVYFKEDFKNDFCIVCVDDIILKQFLESDFEVITVFVNNSKSEPSERVEKLYKKNDYNYIYNYGLDDSEEFLEQIAFDVDILG